MISILVNGTASTSVHSVAVASDGIYGTQIPRIVGCDTVKCTTLAIAGTRLYLAEEVDMEGPSAGHSMRWISRRQSFTNGRLA